MACISRTVISVLNIDRNRDFRIIYWSKGNKNGVVGKLRSDTIYFNKVFYSTRFPGNFNIGYLNHLGSTFLIHVGHTLNDRFKMFFVYGGILRFLTSEGLAISEKMRIAADGKVGHLG